MALTGSVLIAEAWSQEAPPLGQIQSQRPARAASPHIGSAMALLATLQDAGVLPPEGTRDANHIIRFVIQFQSAFTKSDDPAIQAFLRQALASPPEEQAADIVNGFHTTGWTSEILERLSDEEARRSAEDLQGLAQGFTPFNLSVAELHQFMQLVRKAREAFHTRGLEFTHIFSLRRKEMPGADAS